MISAVVIFHLQTYCVVAQKNIDEYVYKRVFIYKVAFRFIDWPENSKVHNPNVPFVISVIGDDPFHGKLKELERNSRLKINNKRIVVRNIRTIEEINGSDILFISSSERYDLSKILKYTHGKPILTIGETKGYLEKGVMIFMYVKDQYIAYSINKKEADASGIYINSQLLGRAEKVIR